MCSHEWDEATGYLPRPPPALVARLVGLLLLPEERKSPVLSPVLCTRRAADGPSHSPLQSEDFDYLKLTTTGKWTTAMGYIGTISARSHAQADQDYWGTSHGYRCGVGGELRFRQSGPSHDTR